MNLREFLAVEVMGWHITRFSPTHADRAGPEDYWMQGYNPESLRYHVRNWRPDENIEQAIMCAEKTPYRWSLQMAEQGGYQGQLNKMRGHYGIAGAAWEHTPSAALSLAVARAAGKRIRF